MRLENKVAIVTGAASGIGRSMVRRYCAEGAKVLAVDIDEARLQKVLDEVSGNGGTIASRVVDVTKGEQCAAMVDDAVERWGRLDVLCNNAGVLDKLTPTADADDELFAQVIGVNLYGPFAAARKAIPIMIEQGGGNIINTASAAGTNGGRGGAVYTASKHAVVGLTKHIAWYYGDKNIRCNAIAPGHVMTRMATSNMPHMGGMQKMQPYLPLIPRAGKAAEVAEVAVFLATDESGFMNGAIVAVDGGWTLY
ncbi:MAG: NAD(P)-dependent dehydrogenase (short-subunit alcohol dehydrogenase family) [Myxococcota bacterium]|jgi:NAD(P)-dependent dehydrogenase (short-subunit alcohol dehydrogenase family)